MKLTAPAKINLALHVTGQRPDGYHLIETLVVFAEAADQITIENVEADSLIFSGPYGGLLLRETGENLVVKARNALRAATSLPCPPVAICVEKNLPLSSGIGGGSADAAATLRGLNENWALGLSLEQLCAIGIGLGADVPMCLHGCPLIAKGIGEAIQSVQLPPFHLLLVNPGVSVSTPAIFRALERKMNGGLPMISSISERLSDKQLSVAESRASIIPGSRSEARNPEVRKGDIDGNGSFHPPAATIHQVPISGFRASLRDPGMTSVRVSVAEFSSYLRSTRNDLQAPAIAIQPVIADAIAALEDNGALFARMSGSGATCFGIFPDAHARVSAAEAISAAHPEWWLG